MEEALEKKLENLDLNYFQLGEILGTGSFARVRIARNTKTKKFYAVKIMKKAELIKSKQVDHVINEIKILNSISHNFIIKLEGFCQDEKRLYLVQELVNGGELFTYLGIMKHLETDTVRFYAGQIVLIFEFLHSKNLIYRDLKPENVLIDKGGYLKLCDFGFSKFCDGRTYTLCGTPEYLPPEILSNKGHGKSADWWTFGVFLYELLVGICPFTDDDPLEVYNKILIGKIKFPNNFDKVPKHLIRKLLKVDLSKRFGNLIGGVNDIKFHKFFSRIDYNKLLNMEIKPPYVPRVTSNHDISNFPVYPDSNQEAISVNPDDDPFKNWR